jgi:branched-chain amino acid transport system permease protein
MTTLLANFRRWQFWLTLAALIVFVIYPNVASSYFISLLTEVFIFAIFAMSLDLLLGYTGLSSFGHAAFFGLGGYILGFVARNWTANMFITLPIVLIGSALGALIIGFFALRTSGLSFLMFTLAASQMFFGIAIKWTSVTGGSDGLSGIPRPTIGVGDTVYRFGTSFQFYFVALVFFLIAYLLMRQIVQSPFGRVLIGIKSNEARMKALGYNTWRYKMMAFTLAGVFAGLSGYLFAYFNRHVSPETFYWTTSGQVMIMVIIGGAGSLTGPALGAMLVRLLPSYVSSYTERWHAIMGLVFILFVLFAPQGIIGLLKKAGRVEQVGNLPNRHDSN